MFHRKVIFVVLVITIIGVTTWPWNDFRGHPHWEHVAWIPFSDVVLSFSSFLNILGNILLFIPLGYLWVNLRGLGSAAPNWSGLLVAFFFSASIELYQVFCHNHFPSVTDLCCNVIGTGIGVQMKQSTIFQSGPIELPPIP